jgi:CelD/BcsL family acetyltransferase involved in cellulose biosynthesis
LSTVGPADWAAEQARAGDTARIAARAAGDSGSGSARTAATAGGEADPPASAPRPGERVIQLIGGVSVRDYGDIVVPRGREAEGWAAILAYWAAQPGWDALDLHALSPEADAHVGAAAEQLGWQIWHGVEETCPILDLPATWDEYLAGLGKKDRHELRRKLRRLDERPEPAAWAIYTPGPGWDAVFDQFLALHRLSGTAKAHFMTAQMESFFRRLLAADPCGWEIALLTLDGQPAAAYLAARSNGRILLYNSGYDPRFSEWSAGLALLAYHIQAAIATGVAQFDFLRGDERYKYDLGARDHFQYRVIGRRAQLQPFALSED